MPTLFIGKVYNPHIGIFTIGNIFVPCAKHVINPKLIFVMFKVSIHNKKYHQTIICPIHIYYLYKFLSMNYQKIYLHEHSVSFKNRNLLLTSFWNGKIPSTFFLAASLTRKDSCRALDKKYLIILLDSIIPYYSHKSFKCLKFVRRWCVFGEYWD